MPAENVPFHQRCTALSWPRKALNPSFIASNDVDGWHAGGDGVLATHFGVSHENVFAWFPRYLGHGMW